MNPSQRRVSAALLCCALLWACEETVRRDPAQDARSQLDTSGSRLDRGAKPPADQGGSMADTGTTPADSGGAGGPTCDTTLHKGEGTYYAADGSGNCSFDKSSDLMVAAMNQIDYAGSAVCGACIQATGPNGTVTVKIVDRCPECKKGDVDFSKQAFAKIAAISAGRVAISWRFVPCAVSGPLRYHFKSGSNQWWSAVQVRDHRHAVATFEVQKGGAWVKVARLDYNFFVDASGMGKGPYIFRVTDVYGQKITDTGIAFNEGGVVSGKGQFPACK
jgi:expansin (peptidoglycan-binding protein)